MRCFRVLRKDPVTAHGKVHLNHLLTVFRKHGLIVPANLRSELYRAFGLRGEAATVAFKQIAGSIEASRESHGGMGPVQVHHQALPVRADVRSKYVS
jgi:hypothetical protein